MDNQIRIKELSSQLVPLEKRFNMLYKRFDAGTALSDEFSRRYTKSTNSKEKMELLKEQSLARDKNTNTLRLLNWAREDIKKVESSIARIKREEEYGEEDENLAEISSYY